MTGGAVAHVYAWPSHISSSSAGCRRDGFFYFSYLFSSYAGILIRQDIIRYICIWKGLCQTWMHVL